jgi:hypothetical protein
MSAAELTPPMSLEEALELGSVLEYSDYRTAARELHTRRLQQGKRLADAEAHYQRTKAAAMVRLIHSGVSATEARERVKGEDDVSAAAIDRTFQEEVRDALKEDAWNLRKLAEWSMNLGSVSA